MKEDLLIPGRKLAAYRKEYELSLQDVGNAIGLTRGHVWKLENGTAIPSFATVAKIADFMNVPLFELFAPTGGLYSFYCAKMLNERLKELGWTLEEVQAKTRIEYIRLIQIAQGEVTPTDDEWESLINALKMPSEKSIEAVLGVVRSFLLGAGKPEGQVEIILEYMREICRSDEERKTR